MTQCAPGIMRLPSLPMTQIFTLRQLNRAGIVTTGAGQSTVLLDCIRTLQRHWYEYYPVVPVDRESL